MTASLGVAIGAIPSLADADPVSASNADDSAKTISKARFMKSPPDRISAIVSVMTSTIPTMGSNSTAS